MSWYNPGPPPEREYPRCPVCGEEAEWLFVNDNREVVGCDQCLTMISCDTYEEDYL